MLEYVFFDEPSFRAFVAFVETRGVAAEHSVESAAESYFEVRVPEEIDDGLMEAVEEEYDRLMDESREALDEALGESTENYNAAGVVLNLKDGTSAYAKVDTKLLSKIMQVLTPEELAEVVHAIVDAVENPDERSLCQRMREGEG